MHEDTEQHKDRRSLIRAIQVQDLPTLPAIIHRILETVEDDASSAEDLTCLLEMDHAISAHVLRLANSAYYGLRSRVDSIRRAVIVLGFDAVRHLALATSVIQTLSSHTQYAVDPVEFWMHSFAVGKASQVLNQRFGRSHYPEGMFTAALLHDIGKYILAITLRDTYRIVIEEAAVSHRALRTVERERLGMDHIQLGAWVADKWCFPPLIIEVIRHTGALEGYVGAYREEALWATLADTVAILAGYGAAGDPKPERFAHLLPNDRGLTKKAFESVVTELSEMKQATQDFIQSLDE